MRSYQVQAIIKYLEWVFRKCTKGQHVVERNGERLLWPGKLNAISRSSAQLTARLLAVTFIPSVFMWAAKAEAGSSSETRVWNFFQWNCDSDLLHKDKQVSQESHIHRSVKSIIYLCLIQSNNYFLISRWSKLEKQCVKVRRHQPVIPLCRLIRLWKMVPARPWNCQIWILKKKPQSVIWIIGSEITGGAGSDNMSVNRRRRWRH